MLNISHHHSPGHACGLPLDGLGSLGSLGITPAYLLSSMQRFQVTFLFPPSSLLRK